MDYNYEKRVFETCFNLLITRYNTSLYENRFVVGVDLEVLVFALLKASSIECNLYGGQNVAGDIMLNNNKMLSVKGSFTGGLSNIRLINKQGSGNRKWETATIFVFSDFGLLFGSPDMIQSEHIQDVSDAVIITKKGLEGIVQNEKNYIKMDLVKKKSTIEAGNSLKASTPLAKQIIQETKSNNLLKSFDFAG